LTLQKVYYASLATIGSTTNVSLSSIAILEQSASLLRWALWDLQTQFRNALKHLDALKALYEIEKINNKVQDGVFPFPDPIHSLPEGISFEIR
jgi:hypothetical protein